MPNIIKLCHEDPRYLIAPTPLPQFITADDLRAWRYGKLMTAEVGTVVAEYESRQAGVWTLVG